MKLTTVILLGAACAVLGFGQAKQTQARQEAGGRTEGIKVHGHWVLEIKNPDGSVASRKEFENSLATGTGNGAALLAQLLGGGATVGPWLVVIFSGPGAPFLSVAQTASGCLFSASGPCSNSLNVSSPAGQLILQGATPPATAAGPITSVTTSVVTCAASTSPQSCLTLSASSATQGAFLTAATVTGISVQVGQAITVTVTISFS